MADTNVRKAEVNSNKIKSLIIEQGLTQTDVAEKMGLSYSTFNLKINNERPINLNEIKDLCLILNIRTTALLRECFGLDFLRLPDSCENATNETV